MSSPDKTQILLTSIFVVLVLVGLVGNVLVCLVIYRYQAMRTSMNYLLLNLAAADMLTVLFISPQYVFIHAFKHPEGLPGDYMCKFITGGNISWIGGVASVFALVLIAFERYNSVMQPFKQGAIGKKMLRGTIITCWVLSVLFNLPLFFVICYDPTRHFCTEVWPNQTLPKINSSCWFAIVGLVPVLVMGTLYSRVVYSLWIKKENRAESTQIALKRVRKKVTKMVLTVSVIYVVCWFPQLFIYLLTYTSDINHFGDVAYVTSVAMVTVNSAVNPVVYSLQNQNFRRHLSSLCCRRSRRVGDNSFGAMHERVCAVLQMKEKQHNGGAHSRP